MLPIAELLEQLTLEEKADLVAGRNGWQTVPVERLGIPSVMMTDGPHGLRKQYDEENATGMLDDSVPATCFPSAATTACSFDPDLLKTMGHALGEEARDQNVQIVLGPGINIKRSPLCGRNFEYFSEDPLLAGTMGAALVEGIQSSHVGACVKHFAANNREFFRLVANSIVDERALHEIYLAAFEHVVRAADPAAVMSSYNLLNGTYTGETPGLVQKTLRETWGFGGFVMSDWGAVYNRVRGIEAGLDLEMPYSGPEHRKILVKKVEAGQLSPKKLDACVARILRFVQQAQNNLETPYECDYRRHHDIARETAEQSAVLLKNDGVLPLAADETFALIGAFVEEPRYQGAGSSKITPKNLEIPLNIFENSGFSFEFARGYSLDEEDAPDGALLRKEAVAAAERCGKAVIFAGLPPLWEFEGVDRSHMQLPPVQNDLITAVAAEVPVVVVLCCGAPVELPWIRDVQAVLHCYLGGEAMASAALRLLRGDVCPSGKLAETYPFEYEDTPSRAFFDYDRHNAEYRESVYVGYRYYGAVGKDVLFPFGFGLSYTTFAVTDAFVAKDENGNIRAGAKITNTGSCRGAEVLQVYTKGASRSYRQLAAFRKVWLDPGESAVLELDVPERAFQWYDKGIWRRESSRVIVARDAASVLYSRNISFEDSAAPPPYKADPTGAWPQDAFDALFERVPIQYVPERPFTLNATLADLQAAPTGSLISRAVRKYGGSLFHSDQPELERIMLRYIEESPFRALVSLSGGLFTYEMASSLLEIANGNYLSGVTRLGVELARMKRRKKKNVRNAGK